MTRATLTCDGLEPCTVESTASPRELGKFIIDRMAGVVPDDKILVVIACAEPISSTDKSR